MMTIQEKLAFIRQISGLTQAQLAERFGVTFVALNRWVNDKSTPRKSSREKIDAFYRELTGAADIPETLDDARQRLLLSKRKRHPNVLEELLSYPDVKDQFLLSLTYDSNRIEGSTFSEADTAAVLFEDATISGKSLTEHLEAKNHQAALECLFRHFEAGGSVTEELLLELHGILMNGIRQDAGSYRTHAVRIVESNVPTANHLRVPRLMNELFSGIDKRQRDIFIRVADIHARFEQIHPFSDGNGRVGRLLMHAMLFREDFPPAVIREKRKREYLRFLNRAQLHDDPEPLTGFVMDAVMEGYGILERIK